MSQSSEPLVSVILPTYNGAGRVRAAIESVLGQSYGNLELLAIDDCSTDGTWEVLSSIQDERMRPLRMPENGGAYAARNFAIEHARGDYLAFIDDDDEWLPAKLDKQMPLMLASDQPGLVHSAVIDCFPGGERKPRVLHRRANDYNELLCQDRIATSTVVLRRAAIDKVGQFDTSFRAFGDWEMWTRVAREFPVQSVNEPLALIHLRPDSIQRGSIDNFERYRRQAVDQRMPELKRLGLDRRAMSLQHYAVAAKLNLHGRREEARSRAWQSFRAHPNAEAAALIGLSLLPSRYAYSGRLVLRDLRGRLRL